MEEKFIELDVSKIKQVPSDTEVPVHDNYGHTERPLCTEFPQNKGIINKLEAIFNPNHVIECSSNLFDTEYRTISSVEELKKTLSEIIIRFDTNPGNYTKSDYAVLMKLLYSTLLYLYGQIITINNKEITPTGDNEVNITIKTTDTDHIEVTTSESGEVDIKAKVGEMNDESESNKKRLVTVNDIRTYIENRLAWQIQ